MAFGDAPTIAKPVPAGSATSRSDATCACPQRATKRPFARRSSHTCPATPTPSVCPVRGSTQRRLSALTPTYSTGANAPCSSPTRISQSLSRRVGASRIPNPIRSNPTHRAIANSRILPVGSICKSPLLLSGEGFGIRDRGWGLVAVQSPQRPVARPSRLLADCPCHTTWERT